MIQLRRRVRRAAEHYDIHTQAHTRGRQRNMVAEERDLFDAERPWLLHRSYKPLKYRLSEEQRRLLLAGYDGRSETIDALQPHFPGVPRWRICKWAQELGLTRGDRKFWTDEELLRLRDLLGVLPSKEIARRLGRSVASVEIKAKRLGISLRVSDGYTLRELEEGLGADHHKIEGWIARGWLRGGIRISRVQEGEGQHNPWRFSDRAIYELVRDHPGEIDPRRADWLWLVGILVSRGR